MVEPFRLRSVNYNLTFTHITGRQRKLEATGNIGLAIKKDPSPDGYVLMTHHIGQRTELAKFVMQVEQGVAQFTKQLLQIDSPMHSKLTRSFANEGSAPAPQLPSPKIPPSTSQLHVSILHHLRQLMSTCLILRLGDFLVYRATTSKSRQAPKEFIVGESILKLPLSFATSLQLFVLEAFVSLYLM